jgi:hypothetical protein
VPYWEWDRIARVDERRRYLEGCMRRTLAVVAHRLLEQRSDRAVRALRSSYYAFKFKFRGILNHIYMYYSCRRSKLHRIKDTGKRKKYAMKKRWRGCERRTSLLVGLLLRSMASCAMYN